MIDLAELTAAASATVTAPQEALYARRADGTRLGRGKVEHLACT